MNETGIASRKISFSAAFMPWFILGLGALFYCYEYLLRISPSVMTNVLMSSFNIDAAVLGTLVAYYYNIYTPMQLPVGVLMDRYGPRRLLIFACLMCVIGTFWFAGTHDAQSIGYSRLLIGFGSAFAFVGVMKIASLWLPERHFALAGGLTMLLGMIGAMVGDNVMAVFVTNLGWRQASIYAAYAGLILTALMIIFLHNRPKNKNKTNLPAETKTTFRQLWPEIIVLIKNPHIWLNGFIGGLMYLPLSAFAEFWGVPFLQSSYSMTRESAAGSVSMVFLGVAIGAPLVGFVSDYIRRRRSLVIIGGFVSSILGLVVVCIPALPKEMLYIALLFFGIFSSVQNLVFPIGREISPKDLGGTAVAMTNALVMLGGVIFLPLVGYLLKFHWSGLKFHNIPVYSGTDYKYALFSVPIAMFLGAVLMFFMPETHAEVRTFK